MERPLDKIRVIENNIEQLQLKIHVLNKDRSRDVHKLTQLIDRSIPKLRVKIKDAAFEEKVRASTPRKIRHRASRPWPPTAASSR